MACVEAGESRHQRAVESRPGAAPAAARSHWQAPQPRCRQRILRPPADDAARLQTGCEEGGARTAPAAAQLRAEVEAAPATRSARGGEATQRESACGAPTAPQPQPHPHPQGHLHSPPAGGGSQPWLWRRQDGVWRGRGDARGVALSCAVATGQRTWTCVRRPSVPSRSVSRQAAGEPTAARKTTGTGLRWSYMRVVRVCLAPLIQAPRPTHPELDGLPLQQPRPERGGLCHAFLAPLPQTALTAAAHTPTQRKATQRHAVSQLATTADHHTPRGSTRTGRRARAMPGGVAHACAVPTCAALSR